MSEFAARLEFFTEAGRLKSTRRANWVRGEQRFESVAEHVWHTTLLAMLFADTAPPGIDLDRVRDLLIVHDLVEVYGGDLPMWDQTDTASMESREWAAGERLMALLPQAQRQQFDPLWKEFQRQETLESRFARAIDAIHPMIVSWYPPAIGHQRRKEITPTRIVGRKHPDIGDFPALWDVAEWLIVNAVHEGLIQGDDTSDAMLLRRSVAPELVHRLEFFIETDRLKSLPRENWLRHDERHETVAEHVWHATLLAMLLADVAPPEADIDTILDMLVVHDLVEVYAGDISFWDQMPFDEVVAREMAAGERLVSLLPMYVRERFDLLRREFQAQETVEARFARAVDTLHPMIISWETQHAYSQSAEYILIRKKQMLGEFPPLWHLAEWLVNCGVEAGYIHCDESTETVHIGDPGHGE